MSQLILPPTFRLPNICKITGKAFDQHLNCHREEVAAFGRDWFKRYVKTGQDFLVHMSDKR
jgi:hypothetical protein